MIRRAVLLMLIGSGATACAQQRELADDDSAQPCTLPVIVAFATPPDATTLAELARGAGVRLEQPSSLTANLYAITLEADGSADACLAAADRLRQDSRVRAVTVDERRAIHTP
jgi:hypothetical protein